MAPSNASSSTTSLPPRTKFTFNTTTNTATSTNKKPIPQGPTEEELLADVMRRHNFTVEDLAAMLRRYNVSVEDSVSSCGDGASSSRDGGVGDGGSSIGVSSIDSTGSGQASTRRRRRRNRNKQVAKANNNGNSNNNAGGSGNGSGLCNGGAIGSNLKAPQVITRLSESRAPRLQIGLNLDAELELKARLQGDLCLTMLND